MCTSRIRHHPAAGKITVAYFYNTGYFDAKPCAQTRDDGCVIMQFTKVDFNVRVS
ncbi:hypothetical protein AGMMS49983_02840 [Clostridia bacterium]|nr:hypothetical protein AGMMS49983_02840 [Clostridia bacterium]